MYIVIVYITLYLFYLYPKNILQFSTLFILQLNTYMPFEFVAIKSFTYSIAFEDK